MKASDESDPHHLMRWLAQQTVLKPPLQVPFEKPLSQQVAALEGNRDAYRELASQMWATIRKQLNNADLMPRRVDEMEHYMKRWEEILHALAR